MGKNHPAQSGTTQEKWETPQGRPPRRDRRPPQRGMVNSLKGRQETPRGDGRPPQGRLKGRQETPQRGMGDPHKGRWENPQKEMGDPPKGRLPKDR